MIAFVNGCYTQGPRDHMYGVFSSFPPVGCILTRVSVTLLDLSDDLFAESTHSNASIITGLP
jgi:hypothetical protein